MVGEGGNIIRNIAGKSYKKAESITKDASKGALEFKSPKENTFYGKDGGKKFGSYVVKEEEERIINVNGHFYNKGGTFEGKINEPDFEGSVNDVYVCDGKSTQKDKNREESLIYNNTKILKENDINITHEQFVNNSYLIYNEASVAGDTHTALWIAHCVNNALTSDDKQLNRKAKSFKELFMTGYSSIKSKDKEKILKDSDERSIAKGSRAALISVLEGNADPTDGAMFWDGMDLVSDYGNKESILQHPKFKQYQSVYISKILLGQLMDFWSIDSNKSKVNAKRNILEISSTTGVSKNECGAYIFNEDFFVGATSLGEVARYRLIATGYHSGTLFYKPKLPVKNEK